MLDEMRMIESDARQVSSQPVARSKKRTRPKPRPQKLAAAKVELPPRREIILRLIELFSEGQAVTSDG